MIGFHFRSHKQSMGSPSTTLPVNSWAARKSGAGFTLIEVLVTMAIFSITALMAVNVFLIFVQQQRRALNQQELQNDARAVVEQIAKDLREGSVDYSYYSTFLVGEPKKLFAALTGTGNECLVVRDALNTQILYRLNSTTKTIQRMVPIAPVTVACNDASLTTAWDNTDISPPNLTVSSFTFFISPSEDPFAAQVAMECGTESPPSFTELNCRWGTICENPDVADTCQNERGGKCYCFPQKFGDTVSLHPRVTYSLEVSRTSGQQTVSQIFQTTVASRIFKNLDRLNTYVP